MRKTPELLDMLQFITERATAGAAFSALSLPGNDGFEKISLARVLSDHDMIAAAAVGLTAAGSST